MVNWEARLEEARQRALIISENIRGRADIGVRKLIQDFTAPLDFEGRLEDLAIAPEAWNHIVQVQIDPKLVFAHPNLLKAHPQTSLHYRGIATLSLKRVQLMAGQVNRWEDGTLNQPPRLERCISVARTYNAVISIIITGSDGWTLENGYRNILATIGITQDGALRNIVGQEGEKAVKDRISNWLIANNEIVSVQVDEATTLLGDAKTGKMAYRMIYGSEPDISFESPSQEEEWQVVSTVEIKSGTDPAGALERLGAIQKSFDQTPTRSRNYAVLGIVTPAMRSRLNELHVTKDFILYDILNDPDAWEEFITEIFHHTLRIV